MIIGSWVLIKVQSLIYDLKILTGIFMRSLADFGGTCHILQGWRLSEISIHVALNAL